MSMLLDKPLDLRLNSIDLNKYLIFIQQIDQFLCLKYFPMKMAVYDNRMNAHPLVPLKMCPLKDIKEEIRI